MDDNLFGDVNGDGQEDGRDDLLGLVTLEMLRQQTEAGDGSSSSGACGLVMLALGVLLGLGWLCSALGR